MLLLIIFPSENASASRQIEESSLIIGKRYQIAVPVSLPEKPAIQVLKPEESILPFQESLTWQTAKVKSGDSLAKIFKRFGFNARTTYEVSRAKGKAVSYLKN